MDDAHELSRRFLASRENLFREDLPHYTGIQTARRYTDLMNQFIRSLFLAAGFRRALKDTKEKALAVIALGSYGRRELCYGSDVDLTVIHAETLSPGLKEVLRRSLYPMWDAKLDVGHSTLTAHECIRLAMNDFRVLTSIMDGRFLLGSRSFYRLFSEAFWSRIQREKASLLRSFLMYWEKRKETYGTEAFFLEPDIKEGLGGLRDIQVMSWMARIFFGCTRLEELRRYAVFSHFSVGGLSHSRSFLLKTRNHLHRLARAKQDRLLLSYQEKVAESLRYDGGRRLNGTETFMKELYLHLNRIRYGHEEFMVKALDLIDAPSPERPPAGLPPDFEVFKGNLVLKKTPLSERDPVILLDAFCEASRRGLFLGSGLIWEAKKIIAREGRKALLAKPQAKERFMTLILKPGNPKILRLALEVGLVTLFIPEFKRIRNLVEPGFYHVETVDLHSLRTVETLWAISEGRHNERWPFLEETFSRLQKPEWLILAGLLHDIGKGYGGDHAHRGAEITPAILRRLGLNGEVLRVVPLLVRHHLLLASMSRHRDLNDEKTAVQVAQTVQDRDVLEMLFLLTLADSFSTGPLARSDWMIVLLTELFLKARGILERGVLASPDATRRIEENKTMIRKAMEGRFPADRVDDLIEQVSSRYFLNTRFEDNVRHFQLALTMGERKISWFLEKLPTAPVTRVILCTTDRPGLFATMVGVFTLNNMLVLAARIFTLKNGLAFDIYDVTNPPDPYTEESTWEKIQGDIADALEGHLPLDERIQQKGKRVLSRNGREGATAVRVDIDNQISDFFSVVAVRGPSRLGLLYELAKKITVLGLDIRFARFSRDHEKMTGDFYVRDSLGQKIQEAHEAERVTREIRGLFP